MEKTALTARCFAAYNATVSLVLAEQRGRVALLEKAEAEIREALEAAEAALAAGLADAAGVALATVVGRNLGPVDRSRLAVVAEHTKKADAEEREIRVRLETLVRRAREVLKVAG